MKAAELSDPSVQAHDESSAGKGPRIEMGLLESLSKARQAKRVFQAHGVSLSGGYATCA
jgi:hypothetical protein